jgi:hemerythrin-like domain-containing protein
MATRSILRDTREDDAIELLMADHERVRELLVEYEEEDEDAYLRRREIAEKVFTALERHFSLEEEVLYPALERQADGEGTKLVRAAQEEHAAVTVLMSQLRRLSPKNWRFDATFEALIESVDGHIEDEEAQLFRYAKKRLGDETQALGRIIRRCRACEAGEAA